MNIYYIAYGPIRGKCGHHHKTIAAAARCALQDQKDCKSVGGYSDRTLKVVEDGEWRDAREEEYLAFEDSYQKYKYSGRC